MSYQIQRSLDGSTSKIVTESQLVKSGEGVLRRITTTATSSGTLKVYDGTQASVAGTGTLTTSGACVPASHGQTVLTSSGAMVAGTHAAGTLTVSDEANFKDAVKASAVLTSDETQPTAGKKVTVGTEVYTFTAAGTLPTRYTVPLGANTAATMVNLYKALLNHELVDATLSGEFEITVTAKTAGAAGNTIAKAEDDSHLDWDGVGDVLTGGLDAETVTIGTTVYRFKTLPEKAYDVKIAATSALSLVNLKDAINALPAKFGITYGHGTIAHPSVVAVSSDATTVVVRGRVPGTSLNALATTETCAGAAWGETTLVDGVTTAAATVTIGTTVYTVVDALSETYGASPIAYQVVKGADEAAMIANLKKAINGTGTAGTEYSTGTVAHPDFICSASNATTLTIVSRTIGGNTFTTAINAKPTTETMANTAWAAATYGDGAGDSNPAVSTAAATITIGNRTYTATLELSETSGAAAVADQILWVTSEAVFLDNLKATINGSGTVGTTYSTGTTPHEQVVATTNDNTTQVIVSRLLGASQNAIATTETMANYAWGAATLASGAGPDGKLLMDTYTPAAGTNIDLGNIEFENGLYVVVGGTSISSVFTYK